MFNWEALQRKNIHNQLKLYNKKHSVFSLITFQTNA